MGLTPLMLFAATLLIVRNQRIQQAWNTRQQENERRAAKRLPPRPGAAAARASPRPPPPGRPSAQPHTTARPRHQHDHCPAAAACPQTTPDTRKATS
jgi:hypothetical protein